MVNLASTIGGAIYKGINASFHSALKNELEGNYVPQQQLSCPQCQQPIVANVEQLFDVTANPQAKQILLSGVANVARCQTCGYEGPLATPIVYHDNEKELFLWDYI